MTDILNLGDKVRITGSLLVDGVLTDAITLQLRVTDPASTVTTYVFGVDAEIVRDSAGSYHFDLYIDQLGTWGYQWLSNSSLTAFDTGVIITGKSYTLEAVNETPAPIPFVDVVAVDQQLVEVLRFQTDATGLGTAFLMPGTYTFSAEKFGFRFLLKTLTLLTPGAGPAKDVTLVGAELEDVWLTMRDLERVVSRNVVDMLFQDTNSNVRDPIIVQEILLAAISLAETKLLRSWSREQIARLAFHDPAVRSHAAWIAIELATERKGEFISADGKGRYWAQYERGISFFDALSKSKDQSRGEKAKTQLGVTAAGTSGNTGGRRKPASVAGNNFVFADEGNGTKHGGF